MKPDTTITSEASSNRLIILDQLRGLCLAIIIIDHLVMFPSLLELMTGRGLLWVSAAEGFFFISGLLVGLVRGRQAVRRGLGLATRKLWARAGSLYAASVVLTLIYTWLAYRLGSAGVQGSKAGLVHFETWPSLLWHALTLTYSYGWSDFLVYYVIYLLLAPVAVWLLLRGKWRWVVGLSLGAWVAPLLIPSLPFPSGMRWQAYFFLGAAAGFHYDAIRAWWRTRPAEMQQKWSRVAVITTVSGLMFSFAVTIWPMWGDGVYNIVLNGSRTVEGNEFYRYLFGHDRTGVLRVVFFMPVFVAFYLGFRRYQAFIMRRLNWLLEPLGANSLYVYIMQGVFAFLVPFIGLPKNFWVNSVVPLVVILAIWYLVKRRVLFGVVPR